MLKLLGRLAAHARPSERGNQEVTTMAQGGSRGRGKLPPVPPGKVPRAPGGSGAPPTPRGTRPSERHKLPVPSTPPRGRSQ
jgi:hypothetical protein